jgi:hypothetical protein
MFGAQSGLVYVYVHWRVVVEIREYEVVAMATATHHAEERTERVTAHDGDGGG